MFPDMHKHVRNGSAVALAAVGSYFALLPSSVHGFSTGMALLVGIAAFGLACLVKAHPNVYA